MIAGEERGEIRVAGHGHAPCPGVLIRHHRDGKPCVLRRQRPLKVITGRLRAQLARRAAEQRKPRVGGQLAGQLGKETVKSSFSRASARTATSRTNTTALPSVCNRYVMLTWIFGAPGNSYSTLAASPDLKWPMAATAASDASHNAPRPCRRWPRLSRQGPQDRRPSLANRRRPHNGPTAISGRPLPAVRHGPGPGTTVRSATHTSRQRLAPGRGRASGVRASSNILLATVFHRLWTRTGAEGTIRGAHFLGPFADPQAGAPSGLYHLAPGTV